MECPADLASKDVGAPSAKPINLQQDTDSRSRDLLNDANQGLAGGYKTELPPAAKSSAPEGDANQAESAPKSESILELFARLQKNLDEHVKITDRVSAELQEARVRRDEIFDEMNGIANECKDLTLARDSALQEVTEGEEQMRGVERELEMSLHMAGGGYNAPATNLPVPAPLQTAVVQRIALELQEKHHSVNDGFLEADSISTFCDEIRNLFKEKKVENDSGTEQASNSDKLVVRPGKLAGGRSGLNLKYTKMDVRGDHVCWASGHEEDCPPHLAVLRHATDRLVLDLAGEVPELRNRGSSIIADRSMLTCYPPGTRYIRHVDNPIKDGRVLTTILYLGIDGAENGWEPGCGGEIRLYLSGDSSGEEKAFDVAPVPGRLLLFWADARVPHEVLPAQANRFAASTWYLDLHERAAAEASTADQTETAKIQQEISKFRGSVA
eukprot:gnl/MRDRNA2_/MRDRNA2_17065_c0_seq1.p1 gnl/MRDRNA2_/MRDRNA2_17065_c0~~gnl/MRDRNA2_/MRDRNA2_17065_c0_seq1.p1  ORF type:complete len:466 (+),score=94.22 gnl/MRDRNA2_/MRDRNA2_17065_c0_seq1:78-1400(+)